MDTESLEWFNVLSVMLWDENIDSELVSKSGRDCLLQLTVMLSYDTIQPGYYTLLSCYPASIVS